MYIWNYLPNQFIDFHDEKILGNQYLVFVLWMILKNLIFIVRLWKSLQWNWIVLGVEYLALKNFRLNFGPDGSYKILAKVQKKFSTEKCYFTIQTRLIKEFQIIINLWVRSVAIFRSLLQVLWVYFGDDLVPLLTETNTDNKRCRYCSVYWMLLA